MYIYYLPLLPSVHAAHATIRYTNEDMRNIIVFIKGTFSLIFLRPTHSKYTHIILFIIYIMHSQLFLAAHKNNKYDNIVLTKAYQLSTIIIMCTVIPYT